MKRSIQLGVFSLVFFSESPMSVFADEVNSADAGVPIVAVIEGDDGPPAQTVDESAHETEKAALPARSSDTPPAKSDNLAQDLQNPVANLISVPFQFNFDKGFGSNNAGRFTLNVQPVIPFELNKDWNLISRTIVPVLYQEPNANGNGTELALGDTLQSFFFSPKEPVGGWIVGFGPAALLPTGTEPEFRSEQFGLGPTAVILRQKQGWTYGALANHIWGLTKSDDHPDVNATFVQPFVSYTFPTATSIALNSEATYDWTGEEWTIPLNLIVSQVVKIGGRPVQFSFGGRYYADSPPGGPEWGLRFAVTFLFPK